MTDAQEPGPSPAELFEEFFGPSIFSPWTRVLLEHADPEPGDRVLDLACGTGTVARHVASEVGEEGRVVGLDLDPAMLSVARERAADEGATVEWRQADAEDPGLPDDAFDLVLCQQGLQFFDDPRAALDEAARVLEDGGRIVLNVWQPLERHAVYRTLLEAEARHLDAELDDVARPFTFGGADRLRGMLEHADFREVEVVESTLDVEFRDPDTFVALTVMAGAAVVPELAPDDPEERARLIEAVQRDGAEVLEEHRIGERLVFPMPNYFGIGRA